MQLRPYQTELKTAVHDSWASGHKRPCLVLPCGGGKTVIVADMAKSVTDKGKTVLFLVHRKELCDQTYRTFAQYGVDMSRCTIGMVQTVTRRVQNLHPPDLIITDENHHCLAASYRRIYEAFPNAYCVGVTATPIRLDGSGLGDINDDLVTGVSAHWLIENGFLSPYRYYSHKVVNTADLATVAGDYDMDALKFTRVIYGDIIREYEAHAKGLKSICYCPTIAISKEIARRFTAAGYPSVHIDGTTPKAERDRIIQRFRDGEILMLCNVDLISEGFDVPDCYAALLIRPTMSLTLYIQQSMRCMRPRAGKTAIIIDYVGNVNRFGLPDDDREWSLEAKKKKKRGTPEVKVYECPQCGRVFAERFDVCPGCGFTVERKEKEIINDTRVQLEEITQSPAGFKMQKYKPLDKCRTMKDFQDYAKGHGYKPGWAWYQAKSRGLV